MDESKQHEAGSATPLPQHTPGSWQIYWFDDDCGPEMRAKAILIAAAPDLLAALKETAAGLYWLDEANEFREVLDRARAAIAKAEGR